ncbi:MAG: hypothetical protein LLG44_14740 [Chloroflexi bacterium]|nr:hypothetical protein [Chloroflexota bacterium]
MSVALVQCPNCGAPVSAAQVGSIVQCAACGSTLEIRGSVSGFPIAKLAAIEQDTSLMAKRQAIEILKERLSYLREQRANIREPTIPQYSISNYKGLWRGAILIIISGSLFVWINYGTENWCLAPLIISAAFCLLTYIISRSIYNWDVKNLIKQGEALRPQQKALDLQINECQSQINKLESDVTGMINNMTRT